MSSDLAIGIAGSGGDGVILLGELLSKAAAKVGMNTMLTKSFGPQIRGGESSSRIRVSDKPLSWAGDRIDALMVFHWNDFKRFRSELMFKQNCEIVVDVSDETPDDEIPIPNRFKGRIKKIPFEKIAMSVVPPPKSIRATPRLRSSSEITASLEANDSSTMSQTSRPALLAHLMIFWAEVTAPVTI